ncbi:MAG: helix-turn-helix domain-containing protein [Bacteroidia bacterium]|jgi:HTH-type transcriptional regulator/antitoxin HipB|nr:helix-turn-helix domain-containing protein [Bacteroidia bacterium]
MSIEKVKLTSLDEVTDKFIGLKGSPEREAFEYELRKDLISEAIKNARLERQMTQDELGKLVGVQRAQISKLENHLTDARLDTIVKVFRALNARITFNVELM